jgi:lantibiotic modifying enzyme
MTSPNLPVAELALEVAAQIGFGIARKAFWSGDRCTWLETVPVMPGQNPEVGALCGSDVYGGTAGIGWFLAEAAVRTGDALLRRTAAAALRQAAARVGTAPAHGFYGGRAGSGAALILAGAALGDAEPVAAGRAILEALPLAAEAPDQTDLISGLAGTVLALVLAARALADGPLTERAQAVAANLVAMAAARPGGALSWPTMPGTRADLVGFAHGTAGIAHALIALDAVAPDPAWRSAAVAAFAYEDGAYDPARGWPDYRLLPGAPADQIFYPVAWCHGAAGIAQGRLAAAARGFDVAASLDASLRATAAEAAGQQATAGIDFTLCHGLLGLADALLDASRAGRDEGAAALSGIVGRAISEFHHGEQPWPSGLLTREELSGLMLGNAGIGWLFLRLADPSLRSVLAPRVDTAPG